MRKRGTAEAATDATMRAEILTYSRTRGVFAGISLEGAVVSQDEDANRRLYGEKVAPRDLLLKPGQPVPAAAKGLIAALSKLSPPAAIDSSVSRPLGGPYCAGDRVSLGS